MRRPLILLLPLFLGFSPRLCAQRPPSLEQLEAQVVADSNDPVAHYQLAMGYWGKKRWDDAEQSLHHAAQLSPSYAEAWLALACLPEARGEGYWKSFHRQHGAAALDSVMIQTGLYYRRAFLSNPMVDLSILGRYRAPSSVITITSDGRIMLGWWMGEFEKGVNSLRQSRNEEAFQRLDKILTDARMGSNATTIPWEILWHHGLAAARTGRLVNAINDFSVLTGRARAREDRAANSNSRPGLTGLMDIGLTAQTNDFRYTLAYLYFLGGKLPEATATFQRVLEFDIGMYQAHIQLARIYEAREMWEEAIKERRSAMATNPDDPSLLIDLGSTLVRAGKLDEGAEVLEQAVDENPRDPRAPFAQALLAAQRHDSVTMKSAYARFLRVAPSSWQSQVTEARTRLAALESH
ncbi:MAG: tetratricopeptide repeat protein [Gemmatimonadota bacterium]